MNTNQQMPATQNEAWGFWGTMNEHANAAWPLAMTAISDATNQPLESVLVFLDSRHGRHFADDVLNQLHAGRDLADAINAATPPDQQAIRHPARSALPDGLRDSLRDHRRVAGRLIERHAIRLAGGLLARPVLPAAHDHVDVLGVELDQPGQPS